MSRAGRHIGLDTNDRFDPRPGSSLDEINDAVQDAVIRDGDCRLPITFYCPHQIFDPGCTIEH